MLRLFLQSFTRSSAIAAIPNCRTGAARPVTARSLLGMGLGQEGVGTEMEVSKAEKITEFQRAKLIHKFNLYDVDGDRAIEHEDFDNFILRLRDVYGLPEGDPLIHNIRVEFEAHWQRMLQFMDENKDGVLDVDEWVNLYPRVTRNVRGSSFDHMPRFLQTMADGMFKLMDSKGDGLIDAEEYRDFFGKLFPPAMSLEEAKHDINHMTQNGEYKLNLSRYREVHADYTYSPSPDSCGRYAMGPFRYQD